MKRKINRVGTNTLTVSLPAKWVKKHGLNKGDDLLIILSDDHLVLSVSEKRDEKRDISLNIDDFSYYTLSRYLTALYRMCYDQITLIYSKSSILYNKKDENLPLKNIITKVVNRFVGAEIISQTATKTIIEFFTADKKQDLMKIEKRIYFLLKETINELLDSIGKDYHLFHETTYNHHDNITKFINYCLRQLNFANMSKYEKMIVFSFYMYIDKVADKIRHLSEKIDKYGCTPRVKKYLKEFFDLFFDQFKLLYNQKESKSIVKRRYDLARRMKKEKFNAKEIQVISEIDIFHTYINYFSEVGIVSTLNRK